MIKVNEKEKKCSFMMTENAYVTCTVEAMGPNHRPALVIQTPMTLDHAVAAVAALRAGAAD